MHLLVLPSLAHETAPINSLQGCREALADVLSQGEEKGSEIGIYLLDLGRCLSISVTGFCAFNLLQMPDILNWFGWCTWDAFYTNVTAQGVKQGLQRYVT
jgi:hypothetical protein